MNGKCSIFKILLAVICAFIIHIKAFSEPYNLARLKMEIRKYHDSGEYEADIRRVSNKIKNYIIQRANDNRVKSHPQKLALILDIDETSLSNYDYLNHHDFSMLPEVVHQGNASGKAKAIRPILTLFNIAKLYNISIFFITGRSPIFQQATESNLRREGYKNWTKIYFPSKNDKPISAKDFKLDVRKMIEKKGYIIVACVGDQENDLQGGHAEKMFKIPNVYY